MSAHILIIDDEADIRNLIKGILEDEGYKTQTAANAKEAYQSVKERRPDMVVLDIWLQGSEHDGLRILENLKQQHPYLPVVMISGHGTIETAVSAIKLGAYDFIEKPFKADRLITMIRRALEAADLRRENEALRKTVQVVSDFTGSSAAIEAVRAMIARVAPTNSRVLLTGEAGTGKDIAARALHARSSRALKPFITLNCATLRPEHFEIELFGAEAQSGGGLKHGLFEQADGGTLFLDEIADMPLETQAKLVRVIQEQKFNRFGGTMPLEVDVRIIASTNRNLEKLVDAAGFRKDLFYRLNVVPIVMPPLRAREGDIPALVDYFISALLPHSPENAQAGYEFSEAALRKLRAYDWPGNVRQLRNVVEWVLIMSGRNGKEFFEPEDLPSEIQGGFENFRNQEQMDGQASVSGDIAALPLREAREAFEKSYLQEQLSRFEGNISRTSEFIGMERSALHRKLKALDLIGSGRGDDPADLVSIENKRAQGGRL